MFSFSRVAALYKWSGRRVHSQDPHSPLKRRSALHVEVVPRAKTRLMNLRQRRLKPTQLKTMRTKIWREGAVRRYFTVYASLSVYLTVFKDLARRVNDLVRLALFTEYKRAALKRDEISKKGKNLLRKNTPGLKPFKFLDPTLVSSIQSSTGLSRSYARHSAWNSSRFRLAPHSTKRML